MPNPDWLIFVVFVLSEWGRKKNEGREKDVFKTYLIGTFIRRSDWDVFPCFQFEPNMNVLLWTSFVRTVLVRVSTGKVICPGGRHLPHFQSTSHHLGTCQSIFLKSTFSVCSIQTRHILIFITLLICRSLHYVRKT